MYTWFWHALPGKPWVKGIIVAVLAVVVFLLLMEVVFPWVSSQMPYNDVVV
ncbi:hypothetical protein [Corynebacterium timonense]|uniref:Uncharacterized protein n=1 Tax=Corynebacterium timonense TaxID=441500 RepID=A0A1H1UW99_9CORY|nr:hypothetical protein [Corynebacterium timonense]SDS76797.1 hypothetical protein SAMN04488539_2351 [Corynebacterium timonense]